MSTLKSIIIDDEPLAANILKSYIEQLNSIELVQVFHNAIEALNFLRGNEVDLIFLDINMPLLDGLSFLRSLDKPPMVAITTAHEEYAVESYELEVLDYLVKPVPFNRFVMTVNKALRSVSSSVSSGNTSSSENPFLFVKIDKKKMVKVYLDDILVVESLKDYIKIITSANKYIVHQTLGSFTDELPSEKFIRIHRSYTINMDKVETVEGNSVEISGIRYTIGRSYINDVKSKILNETSENNED
ncbi:two component transcriptional regulator, LytTR family [Pustulibacterium marinum]|uniref:Two component transcriptional regulator, LytTR family n=1 Tax=Pustulibacterium marinum TaxID=1224947 RepID=A0A1I7G450_9FLAO|nr:response regulator transcription factor [Pustulibacterium marinum]SFU43224.1 two component transcriptional regulator, LytTR family [Pustulibacterium marinum]